MSKTERRVVEIDGAPLAVDFERDGHTTRARAEGEETLSVRVLSPGPSARVLVDGRVVVISLPSQRVDGVFIRAGVRHEVRVSSGARAMPARAAAAATGAVSAPMPGRVVAVRVEPGQAVERGTPLLVIEAMKMQNELFAPASGVVTAVRVHAGDAVERGALLIEIA